MWYVLALGAGAPFIAAGIIYLVLCLLGDSDVDW